MYIPTAPSPVHKCQIVEIALANRGYGPRFSRGGGETSVAPPPASLGCLFFPPSFIHFVGLAMAECSLKVLLLYPDKAVLSSDVQMKCGWLALRSALSRPYFLLTG